jgi:N-acetylglucosamine-6-sulfatase
VVRNPGYAHTHGVRDNTNNDARSHRLATFPRLLQESGYRTAFIGKWHMGTDDTPRPGFDHWVSVKGQGAYIDPELNVDGKRVSTRGYATDIFNEKALQFLQARHDKPFVLYLAHKAVHPSLTQRPDGTISDPTAAVFVPAERHRKLYEGAAVPRRPNIKDTLEGKPALQRKIANLPPLGPETGTSDETIRNRLRMLAAVDEGVGQIFKTLAKNGQLANTLLVFTSDHGYFYGEHGLSVERRLAYEETIRIPLLLRCPRLIKAGRTFDPFILSIDLAPTLLELAGAKVPPGLHGRSFLPLLRGEKYVPREAFLVEHSSDTVFPRVQKMGYQAVRTERWKYIHYLELEGMDELYDLKEDPYEMKNLLREPRAADTVRDLQKQLAKLLAESR